MRNVVQIAPLIWHPQMEVSCSTCGKDTEGSCCLQTVLGQLRQLNRQACVGLRGLSGRRCNFCGSDTPLRELRVGDAFQGRRQSGHQNAVAGGTAASQQLPQSSQPVPPGEPLDDSPLPNCPILDVVRTDRDKFVLTELRRASAMALPRCVVSRYATVWAESLEGVMSGHQSWALLCRYVTVVACSWLKSRKVSTGTAS